MADHAATSIAGAQDYQPASAGPAATCYVCGGAFPGQYGASYAARAIHGVGVAQVCSRAYMEAPEFAEAGLVGRLSII